MLESFEKLFFNPRFFQQHFLPELNKKSFRAFSLVCKNSQKVFTDIINNDDFYQKNRIKIISRSHLAELIKNYQLDLSTLINARTSDRYELKPRGYACAEVITSNGKILNPLKNQMFFNKILAFYFRNEEFINTLVFSLQTKVLLTNFKKHKLLLSLPNLFHEVKKNFRSDNLSLFFDLLDNADFSIKVSLIGKANTFDFSRYKQTITFGGYIKNALLTILIEALQNFEKIAVGFLQSQQDKDTITFIYPVKPIEDSSLQSENPINQNSGKPTP